MPIVETRKFQAGGGGICRSPGARSCLENSKNIKRASEQREVGWGRKETEPPLDHRGLLLDHKDCCNDLSSTNVN